MTTATHGILGICLAAALCFPSARFLGQQLQTQTSLDSLRLSTSQTANADGKNSPEQSEIIERAVQELAIFRQHGLPETEIVEPQEFLPPLPLDGSPVLERFLQNPKVLIVAVLLLLWFGICVFRKRGPQTSPDDIPFEEPYSSLFESILATEGRDGAEEERAWITVLAWQTRQHPLQTSSGAAKQLEDLTDTEQMLAAYLHDGISMEQIAAALKKSSGTLYNLRSTIRKKLQIPDDVYLQKGLRQISA